MGDEVEALAAALWERDPERGPWSEAPDYFRVGYRDIVERLTTVMRERGWRAPEDA